MTLKNPVRLPSPFPLPPSPHLTCLPRAYNLSESIAPPDPSSQYRDTQAMSTISSLYLRLCTLRICHLRFVNEELVNMEKLTSGTHTSTLANRGNIVPLLLINISWSSYSTTKLTWYNPGSAHLLYLFVNRRINFVLLLVVRLGEQQCRPCTRNQ